MEILRLSGTAGSVSGQEAIPQTRICCVMGRSGRDVNLVVWLFMLRNMHIFHARLPTSLINKITNISLFILKLSKALVSKKEILKFQFKAAPTYPTMHEVYIPTE